MMSERPLRILLVEDSPDDAELVTRFAAQKRARPEVVRVDTESGLKRELAAGGWDLVITDYNLPSFSGLDSIRAVRGAGLDLPLIVVSGTIGEDTAIEAVKLGATDYVLKSNLARLPAAIDRALREVRVERERREAERSLAQAQKLESVGRLAGGVAHDVNNVLAAITLFAELAMDELGKGGLDRVREGLEGILKAQASAASIIRQLLIFSRRRIGPAEVLDLAEALRGARPMASRLVGEDVELALELPPEPVWVSADRTQLEQILLNLAVNARDAMPTGGTLRVGLEGRVLEVPPPGARLPLPAGAYGVLTVSDTGSGMDERVRERLFEPFFTTKEPGRGTGLGLSVILGILRQAGGSIEVESAPGRGTTFRVYWPVAAGGAPEAKAPAPARDVAAAGGRHTVLLVEDEEALRKILGAALRRLGYDVLEAGDGEGGLERLREAPVDLLVTDVVMPRLGGPALVRRARERRPGLRVLFLSGYADATLEEYQIDARSTFFLEKPFTSRSLADKVAQVLASEGAHDE